MFHLILTAILAASSHASPAPPPAESTPPEVAAPDDAWRPLERPATVAFRLADGVRVRGTLERWNERAIDGSFGRRSWVELHPDDVWDLYRTLMDANRAEDWLALAAILWRLDPASERADIAVERAVRLDPEAAERATELETAIARERSEREAEEAAKRLGTESPEARPWPADPWPNPSPREQAEAAANVRHDGEALLKTIDRTTRPLETDRFLVYSDLDRVTTARLAVDLETLYRRLLTLFRPESGENANIFWGRAAVFVFRDRDDYRLFEASAMKHLVPPDSTGMTHYGGPKTYVAVVRGTDPRAFDAAVRRQVTLAFLHRYRSPKRLPRWAHEGLAEYVAQEVYEGTTPSRGLRPRALAIVRSGADLRPLLREGWSSEDGPREEAARAVGFLFTGYLLERHGRAFVEYVNLVKGGTEADAAFREAFGGSVPEALAAFRRFHLVND